MADWHIDPPLDGDPAWCVARLYISRPGGSALLVLDADDAVGIAHQLGRMVVADVPREVTAAFEPLTKLVDRLNHLHHRLSSRASGSGRK